MRTENIAPFQIFIPRGGCEGLIGGDFKYVGITQTPTADARAVQHHYAFENCDLQNAMRVDGGHPNVLPELPVGFGEVRIFKAFALF